MSVNVAASAERHECDLFLFARLEADANTSRHIEPHAARFLPVEFQCRIDFKKMIVATYLNGAVAAVADKESHFGAAHIGFNIRAFQNIFTWNHVFPNGELMERVVNGDKLCAVRESGFHLHFVDHVGHSFHSVFAAEDGGSKCHDLRH